MMKPVLVSLLALISTWLRSRRSMQREIVALRHRFGVYQRARCRLRINCHPRCGRVCCNTEVLDAPPFVAQHDEDEQNGERGRWHHPTITARGVASISTPF